MGLRLAKEEAPSKHLRFQLGSLKACAPGIKEYQSRIFLKKNKTLPWWTGIHPPMQGTRVRSLVGEDSTRLGANKPECYNYRSQHTRARAPQQEKPQQGEPEHHKEEEPPCVTTRESPHKSSEDSGQPEKQTKLRVTSSQFLTGSKQAAP